MNCEIKSAKLQRQTTTNALTQDLQMRDDIFHYMIDLEGSFMVCFVLTMRLLVAPLAVCPFSLIHSHKSLREPT